MCCIADAHAAARKAASHHVAMQEWNLALADHIAHAVEDAIRDKDCLWWRRHGRDLAAGEFSALTPGRLPPE